MWMQAGSAERQGGGFISIESAQSLNFVKLMEHRALWVKALAQTQGNVWLCEGHFCLRSL
jgi:hypothetical protein